MFREISLSEIKSNIKARLTEDLLGESALSVIDLGESAIFTFSKFLRTTLSYLLLATVIGGALPTTASAAYISYPCGTGQTYRVSDVGLVTNGGFCTGTFTIHSSATTIGEYAFQNASIVNVTIPSSVTSILTGGFNSTLNLTSITIPSSVTSIGSNAFRGATSLTSINIPSGVTSIGFLALVDMTALTTITVDSDNSTFSAEGGVLFNKLQTQLLQYPMGKTGSSYVIPSSVTSIGAFAFYNTPLLTTVTIPSSLTSIGDNAFNSASGLTSMIIPSGVTSIGFAAFSFAYRLGSITIPISVTSIDTYAFFMTTSLTSYTYCGSASLVGTGISGTPTSCSSAPGAPIIGTATATGTTTATVSFTAPTSDGGSTILSYTATSSPGSITVSITQAGSGTFSVTGLSASTSYTFTITALNSVGASSASAASNSITTLPTGDSDPITTPPTRDSGPPASFLIVRTSPTISLTADSYTCNAGTLIFWRYSVTEEPSKLAYQKISLLRNGTEVASFVTLKPLATFEKTPTWTGSTMTCQIYAAQENTVSTFSSLGSEKYDEAAKAQGSAIKAADLKHSSDRKAAYDKRAAGLLRISDARRQELSQAKTWAQTRAAEAKYRAGLLQTLVALNKEFEIAKQERARAKADAAKAFTQGLNNLGVAIIQP